MNILVTGGNGFIGSHTVDLLVERGHHVTIFDRYRRPFRDDVFQFNGDVKDMEAVMDAVYQHDGVINLAGILGTAEKIATPLESVHANILGALNIYEAVRKLGKPCVQITVGNYSWNNSYAISKYCAERFALMYNKEFQTKIAVVRVLNAYGPRQKHAPVRKVVPYFIVSALKGLPIEIYGDGEQQLDLVSVRDAAEVLTRALLMDHQIFDSVMEAGTARLVTVNHLAALIKKLTRSESKLVYLPMRAGEPLHSVTQGDISTLKQLDYSPAVSLEEGLAQTVVWYKKNYQL